MLVSIGNTIDVAQASPAVWDWCKENLVVANPEYSKKLRMGFWLGDTPKELRLYEIHREILSLPYGTLTRVLPLLKQGRGISTRFENDTRVDYKGKIDLYDFQETAVEQMISHYHGLLQSPAGSGKTTMGLEIVFRLKKPALWLTHTKDLLNQSRKRALQFIDKSLIGTITEGKVDISRGITFATVQTMSRLDLPRYQNMWDVIIVDEAHRCSGSPTAVTQFYKVVNNLAARYKYGLSATVHRSDGLIKATYALLGEVVHEVTDEEVGDKIMQVGIKPVDTGVEISRECLNPDGTLNYTELITYLAQHEDRNKLIVSQIAQNSPYSSLVLSDRLVHLSALMEGLPADLRSLAVMIDGSMTTKAQKAERAKALEDMRTGKKRFLFATYNLAKEGLDIPRLVRLYMATPQKDFAIITQSIGRIARAHDKKADPVCYDFVDDMGYTQRAFKKRMTTYRKNGCYLVED